MRAPSKQAGWLAHAEQVSVRRLEEDVERGSIDGAQTGAHSTAAGETLPLVFTAPADVARLFRAVLGTVQRRIERRERRTASESEALDAMLEHCFETWGVLGSKVRREHRVFERDGWRCTVPGCTSYRNLHEHHIQFRSAGGSDDLANRTTLCAWHRVVRIRGLAPDGLRFELGVRSGHAPLIAFDSREARL